MVFGLAFRNSSARCIDTLMIGFLCYTIFIYFHAHVHYHATNFFDYCSFHPVVEYDGGWVVPVRRHVGATSRS